MAPPKRGLMIDRIPAMMEKLDSLHEAIARVEKKIDQEIADLKQEQIADLRVAIDRIADDQRRLWEAVRALETDRNQDKGSWRVIQGITGLVAGSVGAALTATISAIYHGLPK